MSLSSHDHLITKDAVNKKWCMFCPCRHLFLSTLVSTLQFRTVNRSVVKVSNLVTMDSLPPVDIDPEGKFKYILIRVQSDTNEKYLVRGYKSESYHADILERVENSELKPLKKSGLSIKWRCPGGGRILHKPAERSILVYGYSQGFGRADHSIATELIRGKFPNYEKIEWSNEGY